ncbi:F-box protein At5g50450-like [Curcuma longa]|uniref:F-box protein At5g50450-like n=1 Tax=Curcuma longa TaxID=136217 RepID=UPI003D9F49A3
MRTRSGFYFDFESKPRPRKRMRAQVVEESVEKVDLFDSLHDDIIIVILSFLSGSAERPSDLLSVMKTCKRMNRLGKDPFVLKKATLESISIEAKNWSQPAHKFLEMCADAGNLEACYLIGMIEFYCLGISKGGSDGVMSMRKGLRYLIQATKSGHAPATYSIAVICFNGSALRKSDRHRRMGVALCTHAARLGHVDALRELGHCYLDGYGVPKNVTKGGRLINYAYARELAFALDNHVQSVSASNEQSCHPHKVADDNSFFSDFGGISATPEPHPANRFMAEWFKRMRGLGQHVQVCANSNCCRPEIRRFEFRRCSMCGFVSYCSWACQVFHWNMEHMVSCTTRIRWIEDVIVNAHYPD